MQRSDRATYTPLDFQGWSLTDGLVLTPKFQRRAVWTTNAKGYLIDTILRDMPVPPIFLRQRQSDDRKSIIREVIDGQQRLRAVLEYMDDQFAVSKAVSDIAGGKRFGQLTDELQDRISQYGFMCEVFRSISDEDVLEIFARMNTNSVRLNAQELRNGRFFGLFKRTAYDLALEHLEFWRTNGILTEANIARMQEVELTSELLILGLAGLQDKKKSIDDFYADYDETFEQRDQSTKRFRSVIDVISEHVGDDLRSTRFRRPPLFYSLYAALYHKMFGVPGAELPRPGAPGRISKNEGERLRSTVLALTEVLEVFGNEQTENIPRVDRGFVSACLTQTDNIRPRRTRMERIYRDSFL